MSSTANTANPWAPYDTYKDCSQGICSVYCPQWCYIIFPPPPPFSLEDESGADFSPLIIAVIGILASAFILVSYYAIISKYCRRRGLVDTGIEINENRDEINNGAPQQGTNVGLDEGLIKSITVCKYKKSEGLVEGTDCSVCLSEFQEDESLRLLPKCNHAFHLPCIDTWLKSHSSCPLCRANIASAQEIPHDGINVSVLQYEYQHRNVAVLVIHDPEDGVGQEGVVSFVDAPKTPIQGLRDVGNLVERDMENFVQVGFQRIRRSVSTNSSYLVADMLRTGQDDDDFQMESTENNRATLARSPLALKRSVSTGRFMSTRYGKGGNNSIMPN